MTTGPVLLFQSTVSTSQIKQYFGRGGFWLNTPDMSAQTRACLAIDIPSIGL